MISYLWHSRLGALTVAVVLVVLVVLAETRRLNRRDGRR